MPLPENRIKKIKLPNNIEYDIVPTTLQDGTTNNKLSVPTLSEDCNIATIGLEHTFDFSTNLQAYNYYVFGQVIPDAFAVKSWSITYEINFNKKAEDSTKYFAQGATVTINESRGNSNNTQANIVANNYLGVHSSNIGNLYISQHSIFTINKTGIDNDCGHNVGFYLLAIPTNGLEVKVKILRVENCSFSFYDNIIREQDTSSYTYFYSRCISYIYEGLQSESIESASQTVYITSRSDSSNYYLTFTRDSANPGTTTLNADGNLYYNGSQNALYSTDNGFHTGNTQYKSNQIVYNGNTITWPNSSGTVALTSDITNIVIEDLTNLNE